MPVQTWPSYHMVPTSPSYLLPIPQPSPLLPSVPLPIPTAPPVSTAVPPTSLWTSTTSPLFSLANVFSLAVMSVAQSLLSPVSVMPAQTGPLYTSPVPQSPVVCPPSSTTTRFVYPEVASPVKPAQIANGIFEPPLSLGGQLSLSTPTTGNLENNLVCLTGIEGMLCAERERLLPCCLPCLSSILKYKCPSLSERPIFTVSLILGSQIPPLLSHPQLTSHLQTLCKQKLFEKGSK